MRRAVREHGDERSVLPLQRTLFFGLTLHDAQELFEGALECEDVLQSGAPCTQAREQQQDFVAHDLSSVLGEVEHAADRRWLVEHILLRLATCARKQLHHDLDGVETHVEVTILGAVEDLEEVATIAEEDRGIVHGLHLAGLGSNAARNLGIH